jgi:hypothetical protein
MPPRIRRLVKRLADLKRLQASSVVAVAAAVVQQQGF